MVTEPTKVTALEAMKAMGQARIQAMEQIKVMGPILTAERIQAGIRDKVKGPLLEVPKALVEAKAARKAGMEG